MADRAPLGSGQVLVRRVLEERARALARPLRSDEPLDTIEMVVMEVGTERYGVGAGSVQEVRHLSRLAPVPGTPQFWAGIVSIRGTLYPVLDLRRYLSLPEAEQAREPKKIVLVSGSALTVGLMVDGVAGIRRVPAAEIGPPLAGAPGAVRQAARGVTADLLTVVDVEVLLSDPELVVKEEPA
jgi:purine-binding chemotaxis protein CheW